MGRVIFYYLLQFDCGACRHTQLWFALRATTSQCGISNSGTYMHTYNKEHSERGQTSQQLYPLYFSPHGFYFASASHDRTVRIWSTDHIQPIRIFAGHLSDVEVTFIHHIIMNCFICCCCCCCCCCCVL